jgi:ribosomal protein S27E
MAMSDSETDEAWLDDAIERRIAEQEKTLRSYYAQRRCPRCGMQRVYVSYDPGHPEHVDVICTLCGGTFVWQRPPKAAAT